LSDPARSEPFHALAAALRQDGFPEHAAHLEAVLDGTWTTSSELLAELGAAVLAIRRQCRPLTPERRALVRQCLREVRKAFPGFGWFGWLRG